MPETRYARSGNIHIAYQVVGGGLTGLTISDDAGALRSHGAGGAFVELLWATSDAAIVMKMPANWQGRGFLGSFAIRAVVRLWCVKAASSITGRVPRRMSRFAGSATRS